MKKKVLSLALALSMGIAALSGCGMTTSAPKEETTQAKTEAKKEETEKAEETAEKTEGQSEKAGSDIKFAVIFGTGGLGDNGYNDEVYQGCEMAVEQFGCTFDYCEPKDVSEFETQLRMYADAEEYDVIIAISTEQADALQMVAEDYPDQKFCMLDTVIEGYDNINCLAASYPDQHFLSGVLAGLATKDDRFPLSNPENIVGFCIAMDTPTSRGQAAGFVAGAKYANPDVEVLTNYIGGYSDPATAKELALVMYERGADIVSANAGSSTQGVFYAAEEKNRYVIGTSLAMADPKHSLSTSCKKVWLFIVEEIQMLADGTWAPGSKLVGIPEGICDYDVEGLDVQIPDDITKILEDTRQQIADGKLVLPTDLDQVDAWAKENQLAQ
ncbi:BMP family ABC transporter substrate-binding protein [Clostridium sp. AM58-1XD]|uniref:BMP family ABC transporter substrate-binding protein n=1 Tax=Clostridium sp. AM58-1XD TaxID=2292307 RepID=UPI000E54A049|nr:BMP family ABC transporter substrate-binding protein [Clostridium sp. AM58-1XD]RGY96180.1 BMP family ABC transporter substrate-binding protein [Clostridium sp. AM58-1XD]